MLHCSRSFRLLPGGDGPRGAGPSAWQPANLYSAARRHYTVLVVDDQAAKRYALVRALRASGYAVGEATGGIEALLAFSPYAAVVLDVHLPDADGFAVCREMRARAPRMPIVQVSSVLVEPAYQQAGRDAGADAYLAEPELDTLVATLDRLLGVPVA